MQQESHAISRELDVDIPGFQLGKVRVEQEFGQDRVMRTLLEIYTGLANR